MTPAKGAEVRFWRKVDVGADDECWPWLGNKKGYFRMGGAGAPVVPVRRAAFEFAYETSPPPRAHLVHSCGNRECCNPGHLAYRARGRMKPGTTGYGRTTFTQREKTRIRRQHNEGVGMNALRDEWNANTAVLLRIVISDT